MLNASIESDRNFFDSVRKQTGFFSDYKSVVFSDDLQASNDSVIARITSILSKAIESQLHGLNIFTCDDNQISEILNRCLRYCKLSKNDLIKIGNIKEIEKVIKSIVHFSSAPQFDEEQKEMLEGQNAKNFMKYLFSDQGLSFKLVNTEFLKALLVKKDKVMLQELREETQKYFERLTDRLNDFEFADQHSQKQAKTLVGNILSLYPFFEPEDGSTIHVPRKIDGKWTLCEYEVHAIQMTPSWMGDPYFVYGLKPVNSKAPPIVIFMGTPPPTTKGSFIAEWADLPPGLSIGEILFRIGGSKVDEFVNSCGRPCEMLGQSLGASSAIIYASKHPDKVSKVFAYNPPGLWPSTLKEWKENTDFLHSSPKVKVFRQEDDFASGLGWGWDKSWNVYRVLAEEGTNLYESHIRAFSGQKNVLVLKMDAQEDSDLFSRKLMAVVFDFARIPLFAAKTMLLCGKMFLNLFSKA